LTNANYAYNLFPNVANSLSPFSLMVFNSDSVAAFSAYAAFNAAAIY